MIRCIIIEDEPLATIRLQEFIGRIPDLQLVACFDDGTRAAEYLTENSPELIFLDLHLGETSGIKLMEQGKIKGKVIITTAHSQYALKGYELNVIDYLLKPFVFERFDTAVKKALHSGKEALEFILVRSEYRIEKIYLQDIIYIEGMGDYRRIHTKRGRIMTLQTFKELEIALAESFIQRIHKSFMVNLNLAHSIGSNEIILQNSISLPISDSYRKILKDRM